METAEKYSWLNFVLFNKLQVWDVKRQNHSTTDFVHKTVKLSSVLGKTKIEWEEIIDDKEYPILGVRANGKGVYINRIAKGSELTMRRYQKSRSGLLFYCKVRTVNGQWGIVYPKFENSYGSSNMQYLEVDYSKIDARFFELLLSVKKITTDWDKNAIGADGRHFTLSTLLNLEIPLPSLSEQQKIVEAYEKKVNQAKNLQLQAQDLEADIERFLFEELGIEENKIIEKDNSLLQFAYFKNIVKWGFDYNNQSEELFFYSKKYINEKLKNVLEINPKTILPIAQTPISFIPMECISDDEGKVIELREKKVIDSKGYTKFQNGDLIWARITPCMQNGKSAIVENLQNGFGCGSTEYHVLRSSNENIDLSYIYHILRLNKVLQYATLFFTGSAGQQRVPKAFLEEFSIPLPPLEKQKNISTHISSMKNEISILKNESLVLRKMADKEFEETIFQ